MFIFNKQLYVKSTYLIITFCFVLQKYAGSNPGLQVRLLCDRIIRACNHQLGLGSCHPDLISELVKLVELALNVYDGSVELVPQSSLLYMEKILFHVIKNLCSLEAYTLCGHVAGLLYNKLSKVQQVRIVERGRVKLGFNVLFIWEF